MKHIVILVAMAFATPVPAQTSNDDTPAIENWWDKVGADFFGAATMQEPRPETEIRAQWTGLSADDQAAVLARCASIGGQSDAAAKSTQEGSTDEGGDVTTVGLADKIPAAQAEENRSAKAAQATATGSVDGKEVQATDQDQSPAPDTGLAGTAGDGDTKMVRICDLIPSL